MEARENNFNFIRDEKKIVVPFFQRPYVWKKEHWKQLLNDLKNSFIENKDHFLGSIILKRNSGIENYSNIIDGQQRLTTFSILMKVLYDFLDQEQREETELRTYLFVKKESKINHSKLDKEKYEKILKNEVDIKEKEGIFGCFNYFKKEIEILKKEINLSEFVEFIKYSKLWVVVCLNANEDEQKIFDSINSTGQRLSSTDIIKNALFDKIIKIANEDKAMQYYQEYWDSVFDKNEEEQEFWNEEIETGRVKRSKSEIFLYSYAIIKDIFNTEVHNLSNLSNLYKKHIENLNENDLKELLEELKDYAKIYRNFPVINNKETIFKYENYELRFFHIIHIYKTNTVLPLILFLKNLLSQKENIYRQCLYLLEMLILCNSETKDYNKFFSKIMKKIQKANIDDMLNIIKVEIYDRYGKYFNEDEIKNWLSYIDNKDATLILFWIELYRQEQNKDYKDNTLGLNYVYTLEHLLPQSWQEHWNEIIKDDEAENFIYQIGNMTLLKGKLNSSLQNMNWQAKLNGDGKVKNYISKNADLLINKELLDKKSWTKYEIEKRTTKFINDFFEIWNVSLFN